MPTWSNPLRLQPISLNQHGLSRTVLSHGTNSVRWILQLQLSRPSNGWFSVLGMDGVARETDDTEDRPDGKKHAA